MYAIVSVFLATEGQNLHYAILKDKVKVIKFGDIIYHIGRGINGYQLKYKECLIGAGLTKENHPYCKLLYMTFI